MIITTEKNSFKLTGYEHQNRTAGGQSSHKNKFPKSPHLLAIHIEALINEVKSGICFEIIWGRRRGGRAYITTVKAE